MTPTAAKALTPTYFGIPSIAFLSCSTTDEHLSGVLIHALFHRHMIVYL